MKRQGPTKWQVNCPFCLGKENQPDHHGHMTLYLESDSFKCHRCGEHGGKLALYGLTHGCDTKQAYKEIMEIREGVKVSAPSWIPPKPIEHIETDARASLEECHKTYAALLDMLSLTKVHRDNLQKRGLSDTEINRLGYKSVPQTGHRRLAAELLKQGCVLEGVPGFFLDQNDQWRLNVYYTGIMMPCRNFNGLIQGIQVRKDFVDSDKCYWVTGSEKKGGTSLETQVHFTSERPAVDTALLTEGTMKADITAYLSGDFMIAIPGTSHFPAIRRAIPILKKVGIRKILMCFDMDLYINSSVMQNLETVTNLFVEAGFEVSMREWDRNKKGIDDYWLSCRNNHSMPTFKEISLEQLKVLFRKEEKERKQQKEARRRVASSY